MDGGFTPPPHRPDQPCEIQEVPNLHAPGGPVLSFQSDVTAQSEAMEAPAKALSKEEFREGVLKAKDIYLQALHEAGRISLQRLDQLGQKGASG